MTPSLAAFSAVLACSLPRPLVDRVADAVVVEPMPGVCSELQDVSPVAEPKDAECADGAGFGFLICSKALSVALMS